MTRSWLSAILSLAVVQVLTLGTPVLELWEVQLVQNFLFLLAVNVPHSVISLNPHTSPSAVSNSSDGLP